MAIWYMVKRLDTGEINGHDTFFHGTLTGEIMRKSRECAIDVQRHSDGTPHHLIAYVDGKDEDDAMLMARLAFGMWEEAGHA